MNRAGRLEVTTSYGGGNLEITVYKIVEISMASTTVVGYSGENNEPMSMNWVMDLDLTDTVALDAVFNMMGTNSYEWVESMHDVADSLYVPIPIMNADDINNFKDPGMYYRNVTASEIDVIANVPDVVGNSTFVLEVLKAGGSGQVMQRITRCDKTKPFVVNRIFYSNAWSEWGPEYRPEGNILWTGSWHMTDDHTANLSETIDKQDKGIELVFSRYSAGIVRDYSWCEFFIPKQIVSAKPGQGHMFTMVNDATFAVMAGKYLYIHNNKIVGAAGNNAVGTGNPSGLKYENNGFVLRYVIGV